MKKTFAILLLLLLVGFGYIYLDWYFTPALIQLPPPDEMTSEDKEYYEKREAEEQANAEKAIAALKKLGAEIVKDENELVLKIDLSNDQGTGFTDAGLEHLASLRAENDEVLEEVDLAKTKITNAGLAHLKNWTNLKHLNLRKTRISNNGLRHLRKLKNLEKLDLEDTQISDAGLMHLHGLTQLEWLDLEDTQITDAGLAELQKALPNCEIGLKTKY